MGEPSKSIWYHLGYALETARQGARSAQKAPTTRKGGSAAEARTAGDPRGRTPGDAPDRSADNLPDHSTGPEIKPFSSPVDQLIAAGAGVVGERLISLLAGRRPGTLRLTRAALAGAGAGLALSLFRNGTNGTQEEGRSTHDPTEALLAGAARGVLYGAVLEPRLPGSPLLRGATFGVIEYVTSPFGGLDGILGASSPHRTTPILAALLGPGDAKIGSMVDHVAFGVTLGLLYGAGSARRGSRDAE